MHFMKPHHGTFDVPLRFTQGAESTSVTHESSAMLHVPWVTLQRTEVVSNTHVVRVMILLFDKFPDNKPTRDHRAP